MINVTGSPQVEEGGERERWKRLRRERENKGRWDLKWQLLLKEKRRRKKVKGSMNKRQSSYLTPFLLQNSDVQSLRCITIGLRILMGWLSFLDQVSQLISSIFPRWRLRYLFSLIHLRMCKTSVCTGCAFYFKTTVDSQWTTTCHKLRAYSSLFVQCDTCACSACFLLYRNIFSLIPTLIVYVYLAWHGAVGSFELPFHISTYELWFFVSSYR